MGDAQNEARWEEQRAREEAERSEAMLFARLQQEMSRESGKDPQ